MVQKQQEQLMAAAWQQAGELEAANQLLRQKQLGRVVTASVYKKRLGILTDDSFFQLTSPLVHGKQPTDGSASFSASNPTIEKNSISKAVVSASFRRLCRSSGRLSLPTEIKSLADNANDSTAKIALVNENRGTLLARIEKKQLQVTRKIGITFASEAISGFKPTTIAESQATETLSSVIPLSPQLNIPTARSLLMEQTKSCQYF